MNWRKKRDAWKPRLWDDPDADAPNKGLFPFDAAEPPPDTRPSEAADLESDKSRPPESTDLGISKTSPPEPTHVGIFDGPTSENNEPSEAPNLRTEAPKERTPLGVVKGPGDDGSRFWFVTTDNETSKIGEFVHYLPRGRKQGEEVYAKIVGRRLAQMLPPGLFADPTVDLREIARIVGGEEGGGDLYEVEAQMMGAWHREMGCFMNPRIIPDPGSPVFLTPDETLYEVINPLRKGAVGSAHLGSLLTRSGEGVPVVLSVKDLVSTHLAILAGTGAGKSYTAAVLIEELLMPYNRAAVLIVDPHGEYSTLQEMLTHRAFSSGRYQPEVEVFPPEKIKVKLSSLREGDLRYLLPGLTDKQNHFLTEAYRSLVGDDEGTTLWKLVDLKRALRSHGVDPTSDPEAGERADPKIAGENKTTINALTWKLDMRFGQNNDLFSDAQHLSLKSLFRPGRCSVLQMSEIDPEDQQIIVATLLRRALHSRTSFVKGHPLDFAENLDFPIFVLLEEAHRFCPAGGLSITTPILKTILAEGRKFGLGIGVISQRPGKIHPDILSQCMTQLFLRIVNPLDQRSITESVESAGRDLLEELPALTRGQVVVSGAAIRTPVLCKVRSRHTKHGGQTLDAPGEWQTFFSKSREEERAMQTASLPDSPPPPPRKRGRIL